MRKLFVVAIAVLMVLGITTTNFAAKAYKSLGVSYSEITGAVVKLLPNQGALIVKDNDDGQEIHIHVDDSTLSSLKAGDVIRFNMQGSNCVITNVTRK